MSPIPKPKSIEYFACPQCDDIYMKVDGTAIGLANPPRVGYRLNTDPNKQGPCPKHRKKLAE